jgi:hypothetical protein
MATYSIKENTNEIYTSIKGFLGKKGSDPFTMIDMFDDTNRIIDSADTSKNNFHNQLSELFALLGSITVVTNGGDTIITANTEVPKIHFLAAAICQRFVLECLEKIKQLKSKEPRWEDIKGVVTNLLTLDTSGPPKFNYFYINPVANNMDDIKKILMYQLLLQLTVEKLNPNIDDVLDFLTKIDPKFTTLIDEKEIEKVIEAVDRLPSIEGVFAEFNLKFPSIERSFLRLELTNTVRQKAMSYKEACEFVLLANKVVKESTTYNTELDTVINNAELKADIAGLKELFENSTPYKPPKSSITHQNTDNDKNQLVNYIFTNKYTPQNSIIDIFYNLETIYDSFDKIETSKDVKIRELSVNFGEIVNFKQKTKLIKAGVASIIKELEKSGINLQALCLKLDVYNKSPPKYSNFCDKIQAALAAPWLA